MKKIILLLSFLFILFTSTQCAFNKDKETEIINSFEIDTSIKQVLLVKHTDSCNAEIKYLVRKNGKFIAENTSKAFIGNGIGKSKEGDRKSPTGTYKITGAFGFAENPGTLLPYTKITPSIYACDEDCEYYNKIIDTNCVSHNCHGEHMSDYTSEYEWGLTIDFNDRNEYPKGSNIFIHCKGKNKYTLGCIALDSSLVLQMIKNWEKDCIIHIYE